MIGVALNQAPLLLRLTPNSLIQEPLSVLLLRFNAEQLWQNLIRQGWEGVPPQW